MGSALSASASRAALLRRTSFSSHLPRLTLAAVAPRVGQVTELPGRSANRCSRWPREAYRAGEKAPLAFLRSPPPSERLGGKRWIRDPPPGPQQAVQNVAMPRRTANVHPARCTGVMQVGSDGRSSSLVSDQKDSRRDHTLSQNTKI